MLRLLRGHHAVARKAVAIETPARGRKAYSWKLPASVRRGRYRVVANMVLAGGTRNPGRRTASKAATVRARAA
jgi:hypothetical protein